MENWILRVTGILPETTDMKTIFLERRSGEPILYEAGQFLTLLFSFRGHELRRSYSFSTTPGIDAVAAITVKRVPNGEISRHLLDLLRVGDTLTTLPPAGRFTLSGVADEGGEIDLVFIAAGSGLVPVYSLLGQALKLRASRIILLTQQHERATTPFWAKLSWMSGMSAIEWAELESVRNGRLTKDRLMTWIDSLELRANARFYLCGPPDFMRMVHITLRTLGFPDETIRREHFTVGHIPPAPPVFDATPKKIRVRGTVDHEFVVTWPDSILTAAIRQGIPLPYSCRAGRCSSCVAHCVRGRVRIVHNEVLTDKDLAEGLVLTCVGYAETDVELDYNSSSEKAKGNNMSA